MSGYSDTVWGHLITVTVFGRSRGCHYKRGSLYWNLSGNCCLSGRRKEGKGKSDPSLHPACVSIKTDFYLPSNERTERARLRIYPSPLHSRNRWIPLRPNAPSVPFIRLCASQLKSDKMSFCIERICDCK